MLVAKRKSTQAWVNDLQPNATAIVLVQNAQRAGIPVEDIEVVDVDEATYKQIDAQLNDATRVAQAQEWTTLKQQILTVHNKARIKLGLTVAEYKLYVKGFKVLLEDDIA